MTLEEAGMITMFTMIGFFSSLVIYQRYEKKRRRG